MIGQLRIAEALQVLYQFLVSYEPGGAYVKIGKFDRTGEFDDPDDDPCEDCEDKYTPYCIYQCEHNEDGCYTCNDCNDYRTEYCYAECQYNQDLSPCDDCKYSPGVCFNRFDQFIRNWRRCNHTCSYFRMIIIRLKSITDLNYAA